MRQVFIFFCLLSFHLHLNAQEATPSPILFIYDASGSMWGQIEGKTKKEIASEVLSTAVNNLSEHQQIGLVAYGHRSKGDCNDVEFLLDLNNTSKTKVNSAVSGLNPLGKTPLAHSATLAIRSIKEAGIKATIILITDGIESCDGDICAIVTAAKAEGIDFKLHIVGFGLKEGESEQLKCAANAGNGKYYDASNAGGLGEVLTEATNETVDDPNGNLSIYAVKNGEPVDVYVKANKPLDNNRVSQSRSYRDTAWMYLPPGEHTITVAPLEGTDIPAQTITVIIKEGEKLHRDVSFDGGSLRITTTNNGEGWDAVVKMYDASDKVIAHGRTYGRDHLLEVPAGLYRVTIQALGMDGNETLAELDNVAIQGKEITPLIHDFETGYAKIGVKTSAGELIDAVVKFVEQSTGNRTTSSRTYTNESSNPKAFLLNPGSYNVNITTLGKHKGKSKDVKIVVVKGKTVEQIIVF